jgi:hypothetical protein
VASSPTEGDAPPDDLVAALQRLAEEAERQALPPRHWRKTLVPWRGETEEALAHEPEPGTTLPDADGPADGSSAVPVAPAAPSPAAVSEPTPEPRWALDALPPTAEAPFALEVLAGPRAGLVVGVGRRSAVVGRAMGALRVDDPFVSEGHASFVVRGGQLVVVDGGTGSGVYVSAPPVVVLRTGQCFAVGLQVFRFLGPLEPGTPDIYGAPFPRRAFRVEHVLVGGRSGRVVVFRFSASIGRLKGTFRFPDDELLEEAHAELRPGPSGVELLTHARQAPVFLRAADGADVPLQNGDLVRIGTSTMRVLVR